MVVAGVDIGGTLTKGVLIDEDRILAVAKSITVDYVTSAAGCLGKLLDKVELKPSDVDLLAITGIGNIDVKDSLLGVPVRKIDEIECIGIGGVFLSGYKDAIVVSIGTGTAIVLVKDAGHRVVHVGGTGIGGGTLRGLGRCLLNVVKIETIEKMATNGDIRRVNLTVGDLAGRPVGILSTEITASNFGKFGDDTRREDVAIGIFNLVGEVIGTVSYFASKAWDMTDKIVLVGGLTNSPVLKPIIIKTIEFFGGKAIVPEYSEYCAAIGAARKTIMEDSSA